MPIWIWSKVGSALAWLKRLVISFIRSLHSGRRGVPCQARRQVRDLVKAGSGGEPFIGARRRGVSCRPRLAGIEWLIRQPAEAAAVGRLASSSGQALDVRSLELDVEAEARISLTSTLKLSGMPASKVSSPLTIAS